MLVLAQYNTVLYLLNFKGALKVAFLTKLEILRKTADIMCKEYYLGQIFTVVLLSANMYPSVGHASGIPTHPVNWKKSLE